MRKSVNRSIKEVYENLHKTHLLCLFAHGRYVNQTLNSETLLGAALSIITDKNAYPPKRLDMNYLEKFVRWFSKKIIYKPSKLEEDYWDTPLEKMLAKRFESKIAISNRELVYMFVVVCRCLGMNIRLVLSLQPMSWKPSADALIRPSKKGGEVNNTIKEPFLSQPSVPHVKESEVQVKKEEKKPNKKMLSSDTDEEPINKKNNKKNNKKATETKRQLLSKSQKRKSETVDDDDSCDFDPEEKKIKKGPKASTSHRRKSGEKRSSDGDSDEKNKKKTKTGKDDKDGKKRKSEGLLEWAEVYVEEEEKWICVDITRGKIHCVAEVQVF